MIALQSLLTSGWIHPAYPIRPTHPIHPASSPSLCLQHVEGETVEQEAVESAVFEKEKDVERESGGIDLATAAVAIAGVGALGVDMLALDAPRPPACVTQAVCVPFCLAHPSHPGLFVSRGLGLGSGVSLSPHVRCALASLRAQSCFTSSLLR